jgi:predicted GNAT superfamily acetyltransferase
MIENGVVAPRPISPLERAQAREDVMVSQSIIDMTVQSVGPEQSMVLIDMPTSMKNIKDKLKDKLVTFRTQEEVMQAMMQMQQQQQGAPSDGEPQ